MASSTEIPSKDAPSEHAFVDDGTVEVIHVPAKLRKFTFTKEIRLTMLQAVRLHNAHRAPHGKKDDHFTKVLETVLANLPSSLWDSMQKPTMKTMRDKLRSMMVDRRGTNKRNANSSGIAETIGPAEQLLDDFIHEVDELEEVRARERDDITAREEVLTQAGEQIQLNAITRRQSVGDEGTGSSRSTPRKRAMEDDIGAWESAIEHELQHKRVSREKDLELREEELKLNRERWEQEKLDREHSRDIAKKQMDLLLSIMDRQKQT